VAGPSGSNTIVSHGGAPQAIGSGQTNDLNFAIANHRRDFHRFNLAGLTEESKRESPSRRLYRRLRFKYSTVLQRSTRTIATPPRQRADFVRGRSRNSLRVWLTCNYGVVGLSFRNFSEWRKAPPVLQRSMARIFCPLAPPAKGISALIFSALLCFFPAFGNSIPPRKFSVLLSANVQPSPPRIDLAWVADPDATSYEFSRRTADSSWQPLATLPGSAANYSDSAVSVGTKYEYKAVKRTGAGYTGYGYLASGIRIPNVDAYGKLILLVESSIAPPLAAELTRL